MQYFIGIDVGTSSAKVAAVDRSGNICAVEKSEYDLLSPHGGWSEEEPQTWWDASKEALGKVIAQLPGGARSIASIGISNQMHSLVALDENLESVRPSILHNDARTSAQMRKIQELLGPRAEEITRNPIVNGMTLPSLMWIRDNEPENYARIAHVMVPGDYVRMKLTGELKADHSNASATLLYDFDRCTWSEEVCRAADIPLSFFSPCYDSSDVVGYITRECAQETGLIENTPVVFGGADQVMQSIGCGCIYPGQATVNIGSGAQVVVQLDQFHCNPSAGVNAFASYRKGKWYLMGANTNGGSAYKWFCRNILTENDYDALNRQIEAIRPGSDGLVFLPYLNGERCPHRNADISGVFWGMTYHTSRAHMARSVMEGVTFSLLDCMRSCQASGVQIDEMVALGGGTNSHVWLQMQADIYNVPLRTTVSREQAVLGAAISAAVGCGAFPGYAEACDSIVRFNEERILPRPAVHDAYEKFYAVYKDIYRSARPALEQVTALGRQEDALL